MPLYMYHTSMAIKTNNYLSVLFLACGVGGRKTNISGHLEFTRGPKPHEIQCEWAIDLSSDHIVLILPSYESQGYCG